MSDLNVTGLVSEMVMKTDNYVGPLRNAVTETRTLAGAIVEGLGKASTSANASVDKLGAELAAGLAPAAKTAGTSVSALGGAVSTAMVAARDASGRFQSLGGSIDVVGVSARRVGAGVGTLGDSMRSIAGVAGTLNPQLGQLASGFMAIDGAARATGASFGVAAVGIGGVVASVMAAKAAFNFTAQGVQLAADMEQTSIAFEVMIGNAELAKSTLNDLKKFADRTPFAFPEIANAGKQLLAMQIPAKDVVETLRRLGDVSSGLSQPLGEMAYLFGQIRSQNKATQEDLNQFAGRGVPIYTALAATLNTTELGVRKLATAGRLGFAEIDAALRNMTDVGGKFYGMTERLSQSLNGQLSTLSDTWAALKRSTGEAFIGPASANVLADLTTKIGDLTPAAERFGVALRDALSVALPHAATLTDHIATAMNLVSGSAGKQIVDGSANPAAGRGIGDLAKSDAATLAATVGELQRARDALKSGILRTKGQDLNGENSLWWTNDVPDQVKANLDRDVMTAVLSDSATKARAMIDAVAGKSARGESISDEEWAAARAAAQALAGEVDTFRQTLTALNTAFQEKAKLFAENYPAAAATTQRPTASTFTEGVANTRTALDAANPALVAVADALRGTRNEAGERAAALAAMQAELAKQAAAGQPRFDRLKGDLDPKVAEQIEKESKAAAAKYAKEQREAAAAEKSRVSELARLDREGRPQFDKLKGDLSQVVMDSITATARAGVERAEKIAAKQERAADSQQDAARGLDGAASAISKAMGGLLEAAGGGKRDERPWQVGGAIPIRSSTASFHRPFGESYFQPSVWPDAQGRGRRRRASEAMIEIPPIGGPSQSRQDDFAAARNGRRPTTAPSDGGGASGVNADAVNVNVPVSIDEGKLARELGPVIARGLDTAVAKHVGQLRTQIAAAAYSRNVGGGI